MLSELRLSTQLHTRKRWEGGKLGTRQVTWSLEDLGKEWIFILNVEGNHWRTECLRHDLTSLRSSLDCFVENEINIYIGKGDEEKVLI